MTDEEIRALMREHVPPCDCDVCARTSSCCTATSGEYMQLVSRHRAAIEQLLRERDGLRAQLADAREALLLLRDDTDLEKRHQTWDGYTWRCRDIASGALARIDSDAAETGGGGT